MATYFFDSSALAKRDVMETGTIWVQSLADPSSGNSLFIARITLVELVSAIIRRQRNGDLTTADVTSALTDVKADFASDYQIIEVTAALVTAASGSLLFMRVLTPARIAGRAGASGTLRRAAAGRG